MVQSHRVLDIPNHLPSLELVHMQRTLVNQTKITHPARIIVRLKIFRQVTLLWVARNKMQADKASSSLRRFPRYLSLIGILAVLYACGNSHDRNVFGRPEDDHFMSRCVTGNGMNITLYVNTGGDAAVGTSFSVTAELSPDLAERQILYSDYRPSFTAIRCGPQGFELVTSVGTMAFNDSELDALRAKPRDLSDSEKGALKKGTGAVK